MYEQVLLESAAYLNRNGDKYLCKSVCQSNKATFERISDGWTLTIGTTLPADISPSKPKRPFGRPLWTDRPALMMAGQAKRTERLVLHGGFKKAG